MKITVNVDCTPEEARQFLGLPNVAGLQDKLLKELEKKMTENIRTLDPETFIKTWMPLGLESWGELQKMFWAQMGLGEQHNAGAGSSSKGKE